VNTRISGAMRRTGGRNPSHRKDDSAAEMRRHWRTTLAGVIVATVGMAGLTALAVAPANAEELPPVAVGQSDPATDQAAAPTEDPAPPVAEPAADPAPDPGPAEESAALVEESAAPAEDAAAPPADDGLVTEAVEEPIVALLVPPGDEVVDKVEICHATDADNNPYVINEPAANGDVSGHADHTGPIWFPGIEGKWGDIIPPFFWEDPDGVHFFEGLNWDAFGQLIFENDCQIPPPEPVVTATPGVCSVGDNGTATVDISGLIPGQEFDWILELDGTEIDAGMFTADALTDALAFGGLAPGDHTFTITWAEDESVTDSVTFFVAPCPPQITVVVTECPAAGGEGSALLKLSSLVEGVKYDVWVTAQGDMNGTIFDGLKSVTGDATHVAQITVSHLAGGKSYTAWVHGMFEDVSLDTSANFSLKPCPAAPVTPAAVPTLPATGAGGVEGMLLGSMLLLGLGGALLVARRRVTARELS
jgi:hypothetical protein